MTIDTIKRIGNSPDNETFIVPPTNDVISTFLYPKNWSIPTLFTMVFLYISIYFIIEYYLITILFNYL